MFSRSQCLGCVRERDTLIKCLLCWGTAEVPLRPVSFSDIKRIYEMPKMCMVHDVDIFCC